MTDRPASPPRIQFRGDLAQNPLAEIFTEPLPKAAKGVVALPQRPGLGLTLDKKKIAKYRLT